MQGDRDFIGDHRLRFAVNQAIFSSGNKSPHERNSFWSRVSHNTDRLLSLFASADTRATPETFRSDLRLLEC